MRDATNWTRERRQRRIDDDSMKHTIIIAKGRGKGCHSTDFADVCDGREIEMYLWRCGSTND